MPSKSLSTALVASLAAIAVAGAAVAQNQATSADQPMTTNGVQPAAKMDPTLAEGQIDPVVFHAQLLLDRAGFSPGVIDGQKGIVYEAAIRGFQAARGLEESGELDEPTKAALLQQYVPATRMLRVDESDAQGPFVGRIPSEPADQAQMERLGYRNLLEKLAEKFHTTPATIVALNDPAMPLGVGTVLRLPNVLPTSRDYGDTPETEAQLLNSLNINPDQPRATRVVVDKSDGVVRVFGEEDRLIAQFPATMGSERDPLPLGNWRVNSVAFNPPFRYQPKLFWDVEDSEEEQTLPPGPNGPVGLVWIDLNREHIGIHGTNSPETIKRAESHGCVRLTNWDAVRLTQMVSDGMEVVFQA